MITLKFESQKDGLIFIQDKIDLVFENLAQINKDLLDKATEILARDNKITMAFPFGKYVCLVTSFIDNAAATMLLIDSSFTGAEMTIYGFLKSNSPKVQKHVMDAFNQAASGDYKTPEHEFKIRE